MFKSFTFLNVIIITSILLFASHLNAQRFGPSKNAAEMDFHKTYRYHENSYNRNSLKARIKFKNEFHQRNSVRENQECSHGHKDSAGPVWLEDPDSSGNLYQSPLLKITDKKE